MIRVKTCFVAEGISIDRDTGQVSAYGLLNGLKAESYPLSVQKIAFFCMFGRIATDPDRVTCDFAVTQQDREIAHQSIEIAFDRGLVQNLAIWLQRFALYEPGTVVFRLAIPGHDTAEWTMEAGPATAVPLGATGPRGPRRLYDSDTISIFVGNVNVHRP